MGERRIQSPKDGFPEDIAEALQRPDEDGNIGEGLDVPTFVRRGTTLSEGHPGARGNARSEDPSSVTARTTGDIDDPTFTRRAAAGAVRETIGRIADSMTDATPADDKGGINE
ncbi:MAG: hypothetical protein AAB592_04070 [Patescibacteria group bacterium]